MSKSSKSGLLVKVLQNNRPEIEYSSQELINSIETELLETLWMELAYLDKIEFYYGVNKLYNEFFAPCNFENCDENIEEYFQNREFYKWVDFRYQINYEDILSDIEDDYRYYGSHTNYVFSLEYGQKNNHLNISSSFKVEDYLYQQIKDSPGWEDDHHGIVVTVFPVKEKIIDVLHDRGHKFGELDSEIKEIIVNALIETIKNPHVGPTGRNFDGISQHLLEMIKLHPKTQAEMKAKISLAIN